MLPPQDPVCFSFFLLFSFYNCLVLNVFSFIIVVSYCFLILFLSSVLKFWEHPESTYRIRVVRICFHKNIEKVSKIELTKSRNLRYVDLHYARRLVKLGLLGPLGLLGS